MRVSYNFGMRNNRPICLHFRILLPKLMCVASLRSLQLFEEVWRLEVLGHGVVKSRNHFVDGLLPALLGVLATLNGAEELAESLLDHVSEVGWHLEFKAFSK